MFHALAGLGKNYEFLRGELPEVERNLRRAPDLRRTVGDSIELAAALDVFGRYVIT